MAECQNVHESGGSRSLIPALTVAALAGIALTTIFLVRKSRAADEPLAVDKVVHLCNSAADKLDAFIQQALAS